MSQILKLAHFVEQNRVAKMQIRRGRIEAGLDSQRPAELEPHEQIFALDDFFGTATYHVECFVDVVHSYLWICLRAARRRVRINHLPLIIR
jgi:hypothetical protein